MGDDLGPAELLERAPSSPPAPRRRRVLVVALVVAAVAATAAVAVVRRPPPPPAATVIAVAPAETIDETVGAEWESRTDGRPIGPMAVQLPTRLALVGASDRAVTVVGLVGPGIREPDATGAEPVALLTEVAPSVRRVLRAEVDCTAVPRDVPDDAYRLRVVVVDLEGSRTEDAGAAPTPGYPGSGAADWSTVVHRACAAYLAQRDLTVAAVRVAVSPTTSVLDIEATVVNRGPVDARLVRAPVDDPQSGPTLTAPAQVIVPSGGSTTVRLAQAFSPCGAGRRFLPPVADSRRLVGLVAAAEGTSAPDLWSRGIPVDPQVQQTLLRARAQACGGVSDVLAVTPPGTVSFNASSREVTARVTLYITPGRALGVRVRPVPAPGVEVLSPPSGLLVPDSSGQVATTVRVRAREATGCPLPLGLDVFLDLVERARGTVVFRTELQPQGQDDTIAADRCLGRQ